VKCRMQNAECRIKSGAENLLSANSWRRQQQRASHIREFLHSAFCILHSRPKTKRRPFERRPPRIQKSAR